MLILYKDLEADLEKLFYRLIYDKRLKRSITILEMVYKAKYIVSIKTLEEFLSISRKTVFTTLDFAKTLLPPHLTIIVNDEGVMLQNESNQSIESAIMDIAKQTLSYQIIEHAFFNLDLNIHDLAEKLYVSESTLRVRIKHMNKMLSEFGCKLSYYDVTMIGEEANIRYFYYAYFAEFQELYVHVCEDMLQYCDDIYNNLKKMIAVYDYKSLNYSYQQVTRWLLITKERMDLEKYIKLDESFLERMRTRTSYNFFKKVYVEELSHYLSNPNIPEDEIVWAYVMTFNTVIYTRNDGERILFQDEEDNKPIMQKIEMVLFRALETSINRKRLKKEDIDDFLEVHMAYLLNLSLLTEISSIFQWGSPAVLGAVRPMIQDLYQMWFDILSDLHEEELFKISNLYCISLQLAMISSQFYNNNKSKAEKVLYSFEGESGLAVYLQSLAKRMLPLGVEAEFIYNVPITSEKIESINPDVLVHNYELVENIEGIKTFRMSQIPQIQEWNCLKELVIDLDYI